MVIGPQSKMAKVVERSSKPKAAHLANGQEHMVVVRAAMLRLEASSGGAMMYGAQNLEVERKARVAITQKGEITTGF